MHSLTFSEHSNGWIRIEKNELPDFVMFADKLQLNFYLHATPQSSDIIRLNALGAFAINSSALFHVTKSYQQRQFMPAHTTIAPDSDSATDSESESNWKLSFGWTN